MNSSTLLTLLRTQSRNQHHKLESVGISHALKNDTLDEPIYKSWLALTYRIIYGIQKLKESLAPPPYLADLYSPYDQEVLKDLELLKTDSPQDLLPFSFPVLESPFQWIVPIYTLLGSARGGRMILSHVEKRHPQWPTNYLQTIVSKKELWDDFTGFLATTNEPHDLSRLSQYTTLFWDQLSDQYLDHYQPK